MTTPAPLRLLALVALLLGSGCVTMGALPEPSSALPRHVPPGHDGPFTTWWADGRPKEEGEYAAGQRHGAVAGYHPDGSLAFQGQFLQDVPSGEFITRQRGGATTVATIQNGRRHGPCRQAWPDGTPAALHHYRNGLLHGLAVEYHPNGRRKAEGAFEAGRPEGRWRRWDGTGQLLSEEQTWWDAQGRKAGHLESVFDADGQRSSQALHTRRDGAWRGWMTLWYPDGSQAGLVEYVDRVRQGRDLVWDEGGVLRSEGRRRHDQRVGTWTFRGPDGSVERTVDYGDGAALTAGTP